MELVYDLTDFNEWIKVNDWKNFSSIININESFDNIIAKYSDKELEAIVFGISKHINYTIELYENNSIQIKIALEDILFDYNFIEYVSTQRKTYNILSTFAYVNYLFFSNYVNKINKILKINKHNIDNKLDRLIKKKFNNVINCYYAIEIYDKLYNNGQIKLKDVYRYAKTLIKIDIYSIKEEKIEKLLKDNNKYDELSWIMRYYPRFIVIKQLFNTVIETYEKSNMLKNEKDRLYKEYIKSKYNLVVCINNFYQSNISVWKLIKHIYYKDNKYHLKYQSKDMVNDLKLMASTMNFLLIEFNLPKSILNERSLEIVANYELPVKSYDLYYRTGKVKELLASLWLTDISYAKEYTTKASIEKFTKGIVQVIDLYANVCNVKLKRRREHKNDTGGFTYELDGLARCYTFLSIENMKYINKLNDLINKYQDKRGYQRFIGTAKYYYALSLIYNKHTRNIEVAKTHLKDAEEKAMKSKNIFLIKQIKKVLDDIDTGVFI